MANGLCVEGFNLTISKDEHTHTHTQKKMEFILRASELNRPRSTLSRRTGNDTYVKGIYH